MATGSMETALMSDPTARLPDDLLVEIISRVPYKSTRCCKCVSTRWRDLISHPDHRDKLPRSTLAGFLYKIYDMARCPYDSHGYLSVSGNWCPIDASLSFLPKYKNLELLDCCNGLLLCRCSKPYPETPDYLVCNPATEKWVTFPANEWSSRSYARLGFDPAISSHFYVFELVPAVAFNANLKYDYNIEEVGIYSSKAGGWTHQIEWDDPVEIHNFSGGTFLSRVLYLCSVTNLVAAVDVEGNCRFIPIPTLHDARGDHDVYASRGRLCLATYGAAEASIWVLEDSSSEDYWTLKLNVSYLQVCGVQYSSSKEYCSVISAHPEGDVLIFITVETTLPGYRLQKKLFSYGIDSKELRFIYDLGWTSRCPYLSYVPLFSESLADGH